MLAISYVRISWLVVADCILTAKVAELVDALDLGSSGVTRGGSSPPFRTTHTAYPGYDGPVHDAWMRICVGGFA